MDHDSTALFPEDIARALRSRPGPGRSDYDLNPGTRELLGAGRMLRPAAVLCPLVERQGVLSVILTKRADHLPAHAGQVSFPGGKIDPEDPSPMHAALREAEEEIGMDRRLVTVAGALDPYETSTGFAVTPFVGFVDPAFIPVPDPNEVAEVFETPLSFLMDRANHQRHWRMWKGTKRHFYAMPWEEYYIWGATAGMLRSLSDRLLTLEDAEAAK